LHYSTYAVAPGRELYRWLVNRMLMRYDVDLSLATSGEDTGRLVQDFDEARGARRPCDHRYAARGETRDRAVP